MFCSKCGHEINDTQKFCPKCGTPVKSASAPQETPAVEEPVVESTPVEEPVVETEAPVEEPVAEAAPEESTIILGAAETTNEELPTVDSVLANQEAEGAQEVFGNAPTERLDEVQQYNPIPEEPVKKKLGVKTWIIIGVVAVAVIAAVACVFIFFKAAFQSPKKLMKNALVNYVDDAFTTNEDIYNQNADALRENGKGAVVTANLSVDEGLKKTLEDAGADLDWVDNASVSMKIGREDEILSMDCVGAINDTDIASLLYIISLGDKMGYMQIPEISDKYLSIDGSSDEDLETMFDMMSTALDSENETVSTEDLRKLATKYTGIVADQIEDIDKDKEELEVDGVSHEYYALSADIDNKTMANIVSEVGEEILNDKDLKEVVRIYYESQQYYSYYYEDFDSFYDEFLEQVEDTVDEAQKAAKDYSKHDKDNEEAGEFVVYVNMMGELKGLEFSIEDEGKFYAYYPEDGKDFGLEIGFEDDYDSYRFYGSGTKAGGKIDGEFKIESNEEEQLVIEVVDFNKKDYEKGLLNGEFIVSLGEDAYLGYDEFSQMLAAMKYDFVFTSSKNKSNCDISFTNGDTKFATLSLGISYEDVEALSAPSSALNVDDYNDMDEYESSISLDKLIENLKKAGVPSDYIDMLEYEAEYMMY